MTKTQLKNLYCDRHLSMMEIAHKLRVTHATVLYWLKKHQIPRRSWSESAYVKLNPTGDPFHIPDTLSKSQRELLAAGALLYWAEGTKTNRTGAQIGNLDGRMLQVFIRFLREVCHVEERRLSVYVRVHKQFSQSAARRYWSHLLKLPTSQVFVYPHTDKRSQAHRQWSPYGLATLEFHSTKFKAWLDQSIEKYVGSLAADGIPEAASSVLVDGGESAWSLSRWDTQAKLTN